MMIALALLTILVICLIQFIARRPHNTGPRH